MKPELTPFVIKTLYGLIRDLRVCDDDLALWAEHDRDATIASDAESPKWREHQALASSAKTCAVGSVDSLYADLCNTADEIDPEFLHMARVHIAGVASYIDADDYQMARSTLAVAEACLQNWIRSGVTSGRARV